MTVPKKTVLVRADASAEIGVGHIMRCIALAQAWQDAGGRAVFVLAAGAEELEGRIRSDGAEVARIHANPSSSEDAARTAELCAEFGAAWLILDGYHFSTDYRRHIETVTSHLLVMGDGEKCQPCKCDVILNTDPQISHQMYPQRDGHTRLLLGPQYALLRREFLAFRGERLDVPEKAKRVLVTIGGGDLHNVTLQVVRALHDVDDLQLDLTVVAGASNPHLASLEAEVERSRHVVRLLSNVENMPELMARADLAVTAGGGTCYELAFMKTPMFLITTAKNHERAVEAYGLAKAAVAAGWFASLGRSALTASLRSVIGNQVLRTELVANARRMCDGKGAERVVETMQAISRYGKEVTA